MNNSKLRKTAIALATMAYFSATYAYAQAGGNLVQPAPMPTSGTLFVVDSARDIVHEGSFSLSGEIPRQSIEATLSGSDGSTRQTSGTVRRRSAHSWKVVLRWPDGINTLAFELEEDESGCWIGYNYTTPKNRYAIVLCP